MKHTPPFVESPQHVPPFVERRPFPKNHGECRKCGAEVPGRALDDQMLGKLLCAECLPPGFDSIATLKGGADPD